MFIPVFGEYKNRQGEFHDISDVSDEIFDAMRVFNFIVQAGYQDAIDESRCKPDYVGQVTMYSTILNQKHILWLLSKKSGDKTLLHGAFSGGNSSLVYVKSDIMYSSLVAGILEDINYHFKKQRSKGGYHLVSSKICDAVNRWNIARNLYELGNPKLLDYCIALENALVGYRGVNDKGLNKGSFDVFYGQEYQHTDKHYSLSRKVFNKLKHSNSINHYDNINDKMINEVRWLAMRVIQASALMGRREKWKSVRDAKGWITRFNNLMKGKS